MEKKKINCYTAAISHLREALERFVEKNPCKTPTPECHCDTCVAQHALAATSGFVGE